MKINHKDIFLHKKIPARMPVEKAFAMRNELWDALENQGISCDVGIGGGTVEVIAMVESDSQTKIVAKLAKKYGFEVSSAWLATKLIPGDYT